MLPWHSSLPFFLGLFVAFTMASAASKLRQVDTICISGAMLCQRLPRAKQSATSSSSSAQNAAKDREFLRKLHLIHGRNQRVLKGCKFCGHGCFNALKDDEQGIMEYRKALRMLPKDVQDRDLLWIFGGSADEPQASVFEESSAIAWEQTSPTASSNEAGLMEATSPSGSDNLSQLTGPP